MRVLIACEFSGAVRDAFRELGHEAWSCDLEGVEPEGKWPNYHLHGDCLWFIEIMPWDLLIAHPPCTYLCNSGVRWLHNNPERWNKMLDAAHFFNTLLKAPIDKIAIENPIMHKHAVPYVLYTYDQIIHPWQFGHGETKATCLWLKNLPKLKPTNIVLGRKPKVHFESLGPNRAKNRSRTYLGIAQAMAAQWSK